MHKQTKKTKSDSSKKTVKPQNYSSDGKNPIWCFNKIDKNGKFAFDLERRDFQHKEVFKKIIDYSNLTWAEIKRQTHDDGKSKHHGLEIESISNEANKRFNEMHLEEYSDTIFSFAFQNKLRIVGLRENEYFYVLWYDPNHEIYPYNKKHS